MALIPLKDVRRVFVIPRNSETLKIVKSEIKAEAKKRFKILRFVTSINPVMKKRAGHFVKNLGRFSEKGISSLEEAPLLIILAEKQGFPPSNRLSLAHTQEVLWLKATSLGLGCQLLSAVEILSNNKTILKQFGLTDGKWALGGLVIGYPLKEEKITEKVPFKEIVQIMK